MMKALDLPIDLWIYIIDYYLGPEDVTVLLQTCRALSSLCSNSSVWKRKLKEAVIQDDLFVPMASLNPLAAYKRTVLAPARMSAMIAKAQTVMDEGKSKIYPVSQQILPYQSKDTLTVMVLLPGGRYLIAKTQSEVLVIDILSKETPPQQSRLKSQDVPLSSSANVLAGPSVDGSKLRVAIVENTEGGFTRRAIAVLEFDPASLELRRIASREFNQDSDGLDHTLTNHHSDTLAGDLFCFFDLVTYEIYVWNFVEGVVMSWRVDPAVCNGSPLRKLVIDSRRNIFIAFVDDAIFFWNLNDITSIKKYGSIPDLPPKWRKTLHVCDFSDPTSQVHEFGRMLPFFFSLNQWYHSRTLIPGFDLLIWDNVLDHSYSYTYEITYDAKRGGEPSVNLVQIHLIPNVFSHELGIKHNRLCAGQTFVVWERYEDGRLFAIVRPTLMEDGSTDGERHPSAHVYQHGTELVYSAGQGPGSHNLLVSPILGLSTFDPSSGRLCTTSIQGTRVIVSDYLGEFGI